MGEGVEEVGKFEFWGWKLIFLRGFYWRGIRCFGGLGMKVMDNKELSVEFIT